MVKPGTICVRVCFVCGLLLMPWGSRAIPDGPKGDQSKGQAHAPPAAKAETYADRQQRVLRWTMKFNTDNGDDYRKQLADLGAILAITDGKGGYLAIRNLEKLPAKAAPEDLRKIRRIFWIDNNPDSVKSLAAALGMKETPREFIAFFPEKLEKAMLDKELKYKGREEDDIQETVFKVVKQGKRYTMRVVDQKLKDPDKPVPAGGKKEPDKKRSEKK